MAKLTHSNESILIFVVVCFSYVWLAFAGGKFFFLHLISQNGYSSYLMH